MPAAMPRHQALRQLAADSTARAALAAQAGPAPDDVSAWLADLQALVGVPFAYLVPDSRMLPPESIRFFAVDPNWTAALVDGALSIAATTAPAAAASEALRPGALTAARQAAASRLRAPAAPQPAAPAPRPAAAAPRPAAAASRPAAAADEPATPTDEPATPTDEPGAADEPAAAADESAAGVTPTYSGFLLRSAAVADWPGMQVNGYADPQAATPALPIVRLERLAPTILLALFAGMIQRVDLTEPGQHMYFGVIPLPGGLSVALRSVSTVGSPAAGTPLAGDPTVTVRCRPDSNRTVLDVTATVAAVKQGLAVSSLSPSGLGLQLLQPPPSQTFTTAVATAPAQADSSQATP
jgi:hypothetical protein